MTKPFPDNVWTGFAAGIAVPGLLLSLCWFIMHRVAALSRADLLLIGCIAVNALLLKYFFKTNKENTGRGVLSATFIWGMLFFYYKVKQS